MSSFPGGGFGDFDPRMFDQVPLFRELRRLMEWQGGPVNWDLARQSAEAIAGGDATERPAIGFAGGTSAPDTVRASVPFADAVRTAELWLDAVTDLPSVEGPVRTLSRIEWVRAATTDEGLGRYLEPVAAGMGDALSGQLPEELAGMGAQLSSAMNAMGAMVFGVQAGTISGHMASQLLGTYDLGLPTTAPEVVGTVGDNAARFAAQWDLDASEVLHWLALREAAHRRQYAGVPWLADHLRDLIARFAAEADPDAGGLMEALGGGMGSMDPEELRATLERGDFTIEPTTAQREVLDQIQALVAFTSGWVDVVVHAAAGELLGSLGRIDEVVRRRRAEAGPGERFLTQLIGLDLRPADLRTGTDFCTAVIAAREQDGLDRAWREPGFLPRADELADPSRWLVRMAAAELEDPAS